jgi:flagellar basal body rod protein FlgC
MIQTQTQKIKVEIMNKVMNQIQIQKINPKKIPKKMKYDENDSKYIKGVVKIRNVKVRDLPEMDFMGKCDPYVVFKLGADESK